MSDRTAYPLCWPKTESFNRGAPRFQTDLPRALTNLKKQIELMGGKNLVLSSNYTLGANNPKEPGVVAYFEWQQIQMAIPCDRWSHIQANVQAIALTIEAMRGMERWGAKHMIRAMFTGFKALPVSASGIDPCMILGLDPSRLHSEADIADAYKRKAKTEHPDTVTGSPEKWRALREAHDLMIQNTRR